MKIQTQDFKRKLRIFHFVKFSFVQTNELGCNRFEQEFVFDFLTGQKSIKNVTNLQICYRELDQENFQKTFVAYDLLKKQTTQI